MSNLDFNLSTTSKFMGWGLIYFGIRALEHIACEIISIYKERESRRIEQNYNKPCDDSLCRGSPVMNIAKIMNPMNFRDRAWMVEPRVECLPFAQRFPVNAPVNAEQGLRQFMENNLPCSCLPEDCPVTRINHSTIDSGKCECKHPGIRIGAAVQPCFCVNTSPDASSDANQNTSKDTPNDTSNDTPNEMTSGTILTPQRAATLSPSSSQSPLTDIMSTLPDRRNVMAASLKMVPSDSDDNQEVNIRQNDE